MDQSWITNVRQGLRLPTAIIITVGSVLYISLSGCAASPKSPAKKQPVVDKVAENAAPHAVDKVLPVTPVSFALPQESAETTEQNQAIAENLPPPAGEAADAIDGTDSDTISLPKQDEENALSLLDGLLPDRPRLSQDDAAGTADDLQLTDVVESVQAFFPLLQSAYLERQRTAGDQLATWGEFDTKLKGYTENQPLGFYENYQHGLGVNQPRYQGGEFYSGYRTGRGFFEPWYLERETNKGGEFKAGMEIPLVRDREIDKRRADLWRATYDRQLAEPDIRDQMIRFVFDASIAYWTWVAAGQQYQIGVAALDLAERRNRQIRRRVETGDLGEPDLADNDRAIAQRRAKLLDGERKLRQSAVKLSLFLRSSETEPVVPDRELLPTLPAVAQYDFDRMPTDIETAIARRPELMTLDMLYQRVQVDLAEASNETLPALDMMMNGSQDVGEPTSSKRDKSEFELEAGLAFDMPIQRRKGFGKMRSAQAKLRQIEIKRQFTIDKIATEVQTAVAALQAHYGRVQQETEAVKLADDLANVERRKFELGESDLLSVFLREQIAIEAANELVMTKLDYFIALAELNASLAYAYPAEVAPPQVNPEL